MYHGTLSLEVVGSSRKTVTSTSVHLAGDIDKSSRCPNEEAFRLAELPCGSALFVGLREAPLGQILGVCGFTKEYSTFQSAYIRYQEEGHSRWSPGVCLVPPNCRHRSSHYIKHTVGPSRTRLPRAATKSHEGLLFICSILWDTSGPSRDLLLCSSAAVLPFQLIQIILFFRTVNTRDKTRLSFE